MNRIILGPSWIRLRNFSFERYTPFMNYSEKDAEYLATIIDSHLLEATSRVDMIYEQYFGNIGSVFSRHLKHWKDAPKDLVQPFLGLWNVTGGKLLKKDPVYLETGKKAEIVSVITNDLLALPALEKKILEHIRPFHESAQEEIEGLLAQVPESGRKRAEKEMERALESLDVPVEALRDVAGALILGSAAAVWGGKGFVFGNLAAGQSLMAMIWASNLGWYGSFAYALSGTSFGGWISGTLIGSLLGISGAPLWVSVAGGAGGLVAGVVLIPVVGPFCEWGVNKLKGKSALDSIIEVARHSLLGKDSNIGTDKSTVLAKTYQYGDMLNNLTTLVRSAVS